MSGFFPGGDSLDLHFGLCAAVFSAGIFSFFSPCILPLLPLYFGYFSSDGQALSPFADRMKKTFAFVAGVSTVFFLMGLGAGFAGALFQNKMFLVFCGALIVLMGIHQTGLLEIPLLNRTRAFSSPVAPGKGLLGAFALGFFFSFGWTPCVGPALAMVLGISLQQGDALTGGILLLFYVAGFTLPFLLLAAGSRMLLTRIRGLYPYLDKIKVAGGLLVMTMGIWMIAAQLITPPQQMEGNTLSGATVSREDWAGKPVYLKFWATWCPACLAGLGEFQELAEEYAGRDDVVIYSVVAPGIHNEMDRKTFSDWANGQKFTFPVLFDEGGSMGMQYGIRAYPTSVFLDGKGNVAFVRIGHMGNEEIRNRLAELAKKEAQE